MKVSDQLTDIDTVLLAVALATAWTELVAQYGKRSAFYGSPYG